MKFADLTPEEQNLVSLFVAQHFRPAVGGAARSLNGVNQLHSTFKISGVAAILANLDGGEKVPDETGLAGAQPLVADDVVGFMKAAEGMLTAYNFDELRMQYAKIAGFPNTI